VDGFGRRGDAQEGRGGVKRHAVYAGRHGASPELVQLLGVWDGEDADDGALLGCRGKQCTVVVQCYAGQWRVVRLDDVHGLHLGGIVYQNLTTGGRCVIGLGRRMRRRLEGSGGGFGGQRVDEVVVV